MARTLAKIQRGLFPHISSIAHPGGLVQAADTTIPGNRAKIHVRGEWADNFQFQARKGTLRRAARRGACCNRGVLPQVLMRLFPQKTGNLQVCPISDFLHLVSFPSIRPELVGMGNLRPA
jgi:hypothetical protein